jgi:hypothetical protein
MSIEKLLAIVSPANGEGAAKRSEQQGFFDLLDEQRSASSVILYGSSFNLGSVLIHSILVPERKVRGIRSSDRVSWEASLYDSWTCGLVWGGGQPPRVEFGSPSLKVGKRRLEDSHQIVFSRSFEGRGQDKRYYEIAPFLTHAHGLHWVPERRAWCRFDEQGDIEDVIRWTEEKGRGGYGTATCIAISREIIEMQMSATGMVLVQLFDSTCTPKDFHGWGKGDDKFEQNKRKDLYYHMHTEAANGSYVRGVQIIRPRLTAQEYGAYLYQRQYEPKKYESFITHDFKNKQIAMVSCAPEAIASYFDEGSPLPFQTSPVFFNAAVLDKYKADPEKYSLEQRSITCRNSWHLQTYDVNDAGQVHTYIKYLGDLPHSEQVYWKAFNEQPKGGISKRAFITDFQGEFDDEPNSLRDLQSVLDALDTMKPKWFTLREPDLVKQLHYPLTTSSKAWGDTLTTLAKLVNEGLERRFFENRTKELGGNEDAKWGSIRWAQEAMKAGGVGDEVIADVIQPLRDLQQLRTKLDAHSGGAEANVLRTSLLRQHKSPRGHIEHICAQLAYSLGMLNKLFGT